MGGKILVFAVLFFLSVSFISAGHDIRYDHKHDYWQEELPYHARVDSRDVPEEIRGEGIIWGRDGYFDRHLRENKDGHLVEDFYFHPYTEDEHERHNRWYGYRNNYDGYYHNWDEDNRVLRLKHTYEQGKDMDEEVKVVYEQNHYDSLRKKENIIWYDPVELRVISPVSSSNLEVMQSLATIKTFEVYE